MIAIPSRHTTTLEAANLAAPRVTHYAAAAVLSSAVAPARISPINEFVPFACNIGANVEDQMAWEVDPAREWGYPPGSVLPSPGANKAWRQSTFVAAGVAQAIADILQVDMLDDSDLPQFVTRFRQAIAQMAGTGEGGVGMPEPPPTGLVYGRQWVAARALGPHSVAARAMTETAQWTAVMPLSGGIFTGPVVLAGRSSPTDPNSPVTRAELDEVRAIASDALPIAGGTMTGPLILARIPQEDMEAVPRIWIEEQFVPRPPAITDDAPADNGNYVRQMGDWTNIIDCGDYTLAGWSPFAEMVEPTAAATVGVTEAPLDGSCYFRRDAAWVNFMDCGDYTISGFGVNTRSNALGIPEAPEDGSSYIRRNNGWTNVVDCGNY